MPRSSLEKFKVLGHAKVTAATYAAFDSPRLRKMDRLAQYAVAAARLARDQAGLELPAETAIIMATRYGPVKSNRAFLEGIKKDGPRLASAFLFPSTVAHVMTGLISLELGLKGPAATIFGGLDEALDQAADLLELGRATHVVAGYAEDVKGEVPGVDIEAGAEVYIISSSLILPS